MAKVVWNVIAQCFGANNIPQTLQQYKIWIAHWLPAGE